MKTTELLLFILFLNSFHSFLQQPLYLFHKNTILDIVWCNIDDVLAYVFFFGSDFLIFSLSRSSLSLPLRLSIIQLSVLKANVTTMKTVRVYSKL